MARVKTEVARDDTASAPPGPEPPSSRDAETDVLLVHGVSTDGKGLAVIRRRQDRLESGLIRPMEHGKPIFGEVVRLRPRPSCPLVCDVEVALPARDDLRLPTPELGSEAACRGPAQVATDSYRANWDAIWKRPAKGSLAN